MSRKFYSGVFIDSTTLHNLTEPNPDFQIGDYNGSNLIASYYGIQTRNNGAAGDLFLNENGGKVFVGPDGLDVAGGRVMLNNTTDVTLTSTGHAFQIGPSAGQNLRLDNNEIQVVSNGAASPLSINFDGGQVTVGTGGLTTQGALATSKTTIPVALTTQAYPFQVGGSSGLNWIADNTGQIQARNNGVVSTLALNPLGGSVVVAVDPTVPLGVATKQYVDAGAGGGISQAAADTRYVNIDGDTMTGGLALPAVNPISDNQAARKRYVDDVAALQVAKAGDTMSGPLAMGGQKITGLGGASAGTDAASLDVVTFAIASNAVAKTGDTMTGNLIIGGANLLLIGKATSGIANAGIQTTNSGMSWQVTSTDTTVPNIVLNKAGVGVGSGHFFQSFRNDNVEIGKITRNAATAAVLYTVSSDYRLKNEQGPIEDAIHRLMDLRPLRITWKGDPTAEVYDSFLAHEVAEVVPGAVSGEKDDVDEEGKIKAQGIDPGQLVPLLTAALQEAVTELATLRVAVTTLTDRVAELED